MPFDPNEIINKGNHMKNDSTTHTSQDYNHKQKHIANNTRAVQNLPVKEDAYIDDKRKDARREHTSNFTNREEHGNKE